ncbi:MAG TPA: hypothetical protein PKC30_10430 [Saprospiraceae bacterium]|nr:hypothetical protein [Saprospiraceae bacterium]
MVEKKIKWMGFGLLFIAVVSRLIPHIWNFTAVESIALFAGAYLSSRYLAFIIPILSVYITDLFLNNVIHRSFYPTDAGFIWFSNYMIYGAIALALIVFIGRFLKNKVQIKRVFIAALSGSLVFFVVSNFGVWIHSSSYTKDINGLILCYTLALPFFKNSLFSNLMFTAVLFSSYEYFRYRSLKASKESN